MGTLFQLNTFCDAVVHPIIKNNLYNKLVFNVQISKTKFLYKGKHLFRHMLLYFLKLKKHR